MSVTSAELFKNAFFKIGHNDMRIDNFGKLDPDLKPRVEALYNRIEAVMKNRFTFIVVDDTQLFVYYGAKTPLSGLEINLSNLRRAEDWQRAEENILKTLQLDW